MTSGFYGPEDRSPFDDFVARIYGTGSPWPMRRVIQREVDNELSRLLLDGRISPGQEITVDAAGGQLAFTTHDQPVGTAAASSAAPGTPSS
jgi:C-terminal, D2-small domain, of ClpB protein